MYVLGFLVLLALVVYYLGKKKARPKAQFETIAKRPVVDNTKTITEATDFLPPIPKGYQIFAGTFSVAGISHRKEQALSFARSGAQELTLEREPRNEHDKNAIKVIGVSGSTEYFLGYLPRELSEQVVGADLFDCVKARLTRIFIGQNDFLDIQLQLIGLRTEKKTFDEFLKNKPAHSSQKDYFKFFGIPVPKGMTAGQAEQAIEEHKNSISQEEQAEWDGYTNIIDEFEDKDFREGYDLKRVSRSVLMEAIKTLKAEGKNYQYLSDNIDEVVDRVIELKPELEKI